MFPPSSSARAPSWTGGAPVPRLLALDCSTERLVIAAGDGEQLQRCDVEGGAKASLRLVPALLELLAQAGLTLAQLDAIAVARGPGAFTGLRTATAAAQGLALGAGKQVLLLDSLLIVAEDAWGPTPAADAVCWVAMDARMDEVYAGAYRWAGDRWQTVHTPALWTLPALREQWRSDPVLRVAGSALSAFGERLPTGAAQRVSEATDRAGALWRIAQQAWRAGEAVDAALALPLYLRDKVALTTAEREAVR